MLSPWREYAEVPGGQLQAPLPTPLQDWLNNGVTIPEPPGASEALRGGLSLRLPKTLHAEIAQFILAAAKGAGHRRAG